MSKTIAQLPAVAELERFQQVGGAERMRTFVAIMETCPATMLPGGSQFPLAEPHVNARRQRDLSPFTPALAGFTAERARALDALLAARTIPDLQQLMASGELSAVELVLYYVDRIRRYDVDKLNAILELNPDALDIAAQLDAERTQGRRRGPLHGIPILLKDNIASGDQLHTTAGAYALKDWRAERDAFLVRQLRSAGAVILGKTNLSEWANYMDPCMPNGFSVLGGQTRHPYGPFDPLGSSTGSAVAVAAHLGTASVGSETSGSIIQPARVTSLVGLRPSQGLISRDHIIPLSAALDTAGPMGRWLIDVAILLNVMAGVDANDAKTGDAAALAGVDFTQFLSLETARKVRVGVILPTRTIADYVRFKTVLIQQVLGREPTAAELAALQQEAVQEAGGDPALAIAALKAQGITVVEIDEGTLPGPFDTAEPLLAFDFRESMARFLAGLGAGAPVRSLAEVVRVNEEDLASRAPYGQRFVAWSATTELTAAEYEQVLATARTLAAAWLAAALETHNVDVLVSGMSYTSNAGAAGVPALTIPAGLDASGQPQGIILSGAYLSEPKLFAVGYALEQALHGRVEPDLDAVVATFPR